MKKFILKFGLWAYDEVEVEIEGESAEEVEKYLDTEEGEEVWYGALEKSPLSEHHKVREQSLISIEEKGNPNERKMIEDTGKILLPVSDAIIIDRVDGNEGKKGSFVDSITEEDVHINYKENDDGTITIYPL